VARLVETIAPARLGSGFRWLLASSWVTNLGDGIALAAGPLLIASQTHDPRVVALAALLNWAPQLLLGLYAGALADRLDRRLIVVSVNLVRAGVLVLLATSIVTEDSVPDRDGQGFIRTDGSTLQGATTIELTEAEKTKAMAKSLVLQGGTTTDPGGNTDEQPRVPAQRDRRQQPDQHR